jgi:hypothetical protein
MPAAPWSTTRCGEHPITVADRLWHDMPAARMPPAAKRFIEDGHGCPPAASGEHARSDPPASRGRDAQMSCSRADRDAGGSRGRRKPPPKAKKTRRAATFGERHDAALARAAGCRTVRAAEAGCRRMNGDGRGYEAGAARGRAWSPRFASPRSRRISPWAAQILTRSVRTLFPKRKIFFPGREPPSTAPAQPSAAGDDVARRAVRPRGARAAPSSSWRSPADGRARVRAGSGR